MDGPQAINESTASAQALPLPPSLTQPSRELGGSGFAQGQESEGQVSMASLSLIIPAYNEEASIEMVIDNALAVLPRCARQWEIIVVSDGSTDRTVELALAKGVHVATHPVNLGYGNSLKTGILRARYPLVAICDADGSYPLEELLRLGPHSADFDMVVGQRTGPEFRGSTWKSVGRKLQLFLAQFTTGTRIPDPNSGLRIFSREVALRHFDTLCGGFSFTTSITLALLSQGYAVKFVPVEYKPRIGASHVRYWRDSLRSLQIIINAILRYNPIKAFILLLIFPAALAFVSAAIGLAVVVKQVVHRWPAWRSVVYG